MDTPTPAPATPSPVPRRWPRRVATGVAIVAVLAAAGAWYLGRPATLQSLAQKVANATGGKLTLSGISGSLYGPMHIARIAYRTPDQLLTIDNVDIVWSPSGLIGGSLAIDKLYAGALRSETLRETPPQPMPATLAPPFGLDVRDARLAKAVFVSKGAATEIDNVRLSVSGGASGWHLRSATASTPWGALAASGTIDGTKPYKLDANASLAQDATSTPHPARLALHAGGNLATTIIDAQGQAGRATGTGHVELAPYEAIPLHAFTINGRNVDPGFFSPGLPTADLTFSVAARIKAGNAVSGNLDITNDGPAGTIDQQRLPLRALRARLGGDLTALSVSGVLIDLGAAGQFTGNGSVHRATGEAGLGQADFVLRTEHLDLHEIHSLIRKTAIAGNLELAGAEKTQTLRGKFAEKNLRLDLNAALSGTALELKQARLGVGSGVIDLAGRASLAGDKAFSVKGNVAHFNPAALGELPQADLNAALQARGKLAPAWATTVDFTVTPSRLFGQPLSGKGKLDADAQHVSSVDASLALGQNAAQLSGSFGAPGEHLRWRVEGRQLDVLRAGLYGSVVASGELTGTMAAPHTSFEVNANGLGWAADRGKAGGGIVQARGEASLASEGGKRVAAVKASGSAQRFNPAAFGSPLAGSIDATFDGNARFGAAWRGALDLAVQPQSTLSGSPLSGRARFDADRARISNTDVELHLGPNLVSARGAFGTARDTLDWRIDAPRLAALGPGYAGALRGAGTLSGTIDAPALTTTLDGQGLAFLGRYAVRTLHATASLGTGRGPMDPVAADVQLTDLAAGTARVAALRLQSSGTRAAHTLGLAARGDGFDAALDLRGGWTGNAWNGTVGVLRNRGRYAFELQAPVPLRIATLPGAGLAGLAHPDQLAFNGAVIRLPAGTVTVESLVKLGPRWNSRGSATGIPLNYLTQVSPDLADTVSGDLTLGAQWSLDLRTAAATGGAPALDGMAHLFRERGDLTVGTEIPVTLGLRQLDARADVAAGTLRAQLDMEGVKPGRTHLEATAQLVQGLLSDASPLRLAANADIPSIAWLAPLAGQPGLDLDGTLKLALAGTGTIGAPGLDGTVSGDNLAVRWTEQGLNLRGGQLRAQVAGDELRLQRLSFNGPHGTATAEGTMRLAGSASNVQLKLVADKLEALSRPDRTVVVSGQATLVRDASRFALEGSFRADRALIELAPQGRPTMSDDVVVLGRTAPQQQARPEAAQPLVVDLTAELGDDFRLRGKGIDATLGGSLHLRRTGSRAPRVNGTIRVASGTYSAYGQKLTIDRGLLTFSGPYDNPSLDILAVRKTPGGGQPSETNVEAGVEVRGTAQAPVAKLVSTPTVSDSEKLSWLVLGHGMQGTTGTEADVLGAAASALLSGSGGGFPSKVAGSLGLDEIGVSGASAKGLESTVVTVGKRLSSRTYLSFEQGASTASSVVRLRYKLNPRITLQLQTGTNTALDVLYSWAFD
nr:translocation/assembly module TamB domain-containing protein [Massilia solisilvae]